MKLKLFIFFFILFNIYFYSLENIEPDKNSIPLDNSNQKTINKAREKDKKLIDKKLINEKSQKKLQQEEKTFPQYVIYYKPEKLIDRSIEASISFVVKSALYELNEEKFIVYLDDKYYSNYVSLYNLNDKYSLSDFFLKTNVTSSIDWIIQDTDGIVLVKVFVNDFINDKVYLFQSILYSKNINDSDFLLLKDSLKKFFKDNIPVLSEKELSRMKIEKRKLIRKNDLYNINFSINSGVAIKDIFSDGTSLLGFGPLIYFDINFKIKKVYFGIYSNYSPYFSIFRKEYSMGDLEIKDNSLLNLNNFRAGLNLGFLFPDEIFGMGIGVDYSFNQIYFIYYKDSNYKEREVELRNYNLLFFYLDFVLKPYKNIIISTDVGAFISPDNISYVFPNPTFAAYIKPGFKYIFSNNFLINFNLMFYFVNYRSREDSFLSKPCSEVSLIFGMGYNYSWNKK